jgi:hypothetical protein
LAAAGAAGTSAFFVKLRPFLVAASVLFVAIGFYQARRLQRCGTRPHMVSRMILGLSAVVVLVSTLFPQVMANLAADLLAR